jgi:hypothetical protein
MDDPGHRCHLPNRAAMADGGRLGSRSIWSAKADGAISRKADEGRHYWAGRCNSKHRTNDMRCYRRGDHTGAETLAWPPHRPGVRIQPELRQWSRVLPNVQLELREWVPAELRGPVVPAVERRTGMATRTSARDVPVAAYLQASPALKGNTRQSPRQPRRQPLSSIRNDNSTWAEPCKWKVPK